MASWAHLKLFREPGNLDFPSPEAGDCSLGLSFPWGLCQLFGGRDVSMVVVRSSARRSFSHREIFFFCRLNLVHLCKAFASTIWHFPVNGSFEKSLTSARKHLPSSPFCKPFPEDASKWLHCRSVVLGSGPSSTRKCLDAPTHLISSGGC